MRTKPTAQIWGPLEDMIQAINQTPDSIFVREMTPFLDLGLFAKFIAVENFLAEDDGILGYAGLNNFYVYRFEDSNRFQFLPWDKDNTFVSPELWIFHNVNENVLARRTLNVEEYRNRFLDTLLEAAQSVDEPEQTEESEESDDGDPAEESDGPGWLEREVTRQYNQIRTFARSDTFKPYSNDEFEEAYQRLLEFARNRSGYVREKVNEVRPRR